MALPVPSAACGRLLVGPALVLLLLLLDQRPLLVAASPLGDRRWPDDTEAATLLALPRPAPQTASDWLAQYMSDLQERGELAAAAARLSPPPVPPRSDPELRLPELQELHELHELHELPELPQSSAAQLLQLLPMARPPGSMSKRQIRYHQCYFNPIACFRRRK